MISEEENFLGELRLGQRMTTVSQVVAVGIVIPMGLLFLLMEPLLSLTGSKAPFSVILAAAVLGLTLLNGLELLGGSREKGGTYLLIQETLGGLGAFLAGWSILAGGISLGTVLTQAAGSHLWLMLGRDGSMISGGLIILATVILFQLFQFLPHRMRVPSGALVLFGALLVILGSTLPGVSFSPAPVSPPVTLNIILRSTAWLMAGYAGFEALLIYRRQIAKPEKRLPPAILSLLILGCLLWVGGALVAWGGKFTIELGTTTPFTNSLAALSLLPEWLVRGVSFLALLMAANGALMVAVRQIHRFSRNGAFPQELRIMVRPFRIPLGLFGLLAVVVVPLQVILEPWTLVELAAGSFLVAMLFLNLAAIYSRRNEPHRRRTFELPFSPLIPAVAIGVDLALFLSLPFPVLAGSLLWLGAGSVFYYSYARQRQVFAQEGEVVFGSGRQHQKSGFRILVPIGQGHQREFVLGLAVALARQENGDVIPLQVITVPDPLAIEEGRRMAQERNTLFKWSTRVAETAGVSTFPITRLARSVPDGIVDTAVEEDCDLILLSWNSKNKAKEGRLGTVLEAVSRKAPCDVAVVAYDPEQQRLQDDEEGMFRAERVLVPTAGGPHAPLAIRLALLLTRDHDAVVEAVYVATTKGSLEETEEGKKRIQQTIAALREQEASLPAENVTRQNLGEIPVEGRVITASGVVEGITRAGAECDLILIGASEESLIDQVLFGNLPEQVARQSSTPVIMVKRYRGLPRFWLQRLWDTIFEALPKIKVDQRKEVFNRLFHGARPSVDFFVMMGLSTMIATFGLLQNSTAVIIGAMLVAPLFTPLMAVSLGIVQGDIRLLMLAVGATLQGAALAIGLAVIMTVLTPLKPITAEILARTQPNLIDLGVALASGIVGAYAISREEVAAALPGVAIAAALVPPLGVVGIGLGVGDLSIAGGGGLLVVTNLIAIALAGAITLVLLGFRPSGRQSNMRLQRTLVTTLVLFILVTIPLAVVFVRSVRSTQTARLVRQTLQEKLNVIPELELVSEDDIRILQVENGLEITVPVYSRRPVSSELVKTLSAEMSEILKTPVKLRLVTFAIVESPLSSP